MSDKPKILIAGAGLGGLTAAASLLQSGYRVRVFEQAAELGEIGAGIQMSANAVKVLWHLGLNGALEKIGVQPKAYVFRLFRSGEILQDFPLGEEHFRLHGAPYYQFHRADIHAALAAKVRALDREAVQLDSAVHGFEQEGARLSLRLSGGRQEDGDLLVGADGIKSAVRAQMIGEVGAQFTGDVAWRILVPKTRLPENFMDRVMTVWVGPGAHAVMYYVRGGQLINFVGSVEDPGWRDESWTVKSDWTKMRDDFSGWHEDVRQLIGAVDRDQCYRWAMFKRPRLDRWSQGRVTLLGDSAHATLPYLAQGAAMAIEDAAILTRCLDARDSIEAALQLYERNRIPRTSRVVEESSANRELFHLEDEARLREAFGKRRVGAERNSWLYSYDPWSVALV